MELNDGKVEWLEIKENDISPSSASASRKTALAENKRDIYK